jgi:hypothetical protein
LNCFDAIDDNGNTSIPTAGLGGEIGRHKGLKIPRL